MSLTDLYPLGQITDLGDVFEQRRLIIKGKRAHFQLHDGTDRDTTTADRVANSTPAVPLTTGRIHVVRDLAQDKKFTRTYAPVDEFGSPTGTPFDGTQTFTTANPELINVTDNGDGSAVIAAVGGVLGAAGLTFTATPTSGGVAVVIEDTINVVVGAAEGFAATDSPDEEVTPDV
jgi:hypothetical protein